MSTKNAELYAIKKTIEWTKNLIITSHFWIFTDSQNSIKSIEKSNHFLTNEIHATLDEFHNHEISPHIHWIPEHANIPENEKTDFLVKLTLTSASNTISSNRFLSFDF